LTTAFFGINDEYVEKAWEAMFLLAYYGNISILTSYNMSVGLRRFLIEKLSAKLEEEKPKKNSGPPSFNHP